MTFSSDLGAVEENEGSKWRVGVSVDVEITVKDESAITRCVENWDENGVPQPYERGGAGWRNYMYNLDTRDKVLEHFAYNATVNGARDLRRLDGWADMPDDAVQMRVLDVQLDYVSTA